jgi:hypothetical protein
MNLVKKAQIELLDFHSKLNREVAEASFEQVEVSAYWESIRELAELNVKRLHVAAQQLEIDSERDYFEFEDALWRSKHFLNEARQESDYVLASWLLRASKVLLERLAKQNLIAASESESLAVAFSGRTRPSPPGPVSYSRLDENPGTSPGIFIYAPIQ